MKLEQLAVALHLPFRGDGNTEIEQLAPIDRADDRDLAFVVSARYSDALQKSRAAAVIVPESLAAKAPGSCLISDNPYASYAQASWLLTPELVPEQGVHPTAVIDPSATLGADVRIGAYAWVDAEARIGDGAMVGAHCVIGTGSALGARTRLFDRVSIYHHCVLGNDCRVQAGAVIGAEGFGYAFADNHWLAIHQTGRVVIGNRVHIGANTTIDRGAIDDTVIADGAILDNQIQIAHNVQIGENTAIAGCVGVAGSTRIGKGCQIGGACNIVGHIDIADNVVIGAASLVARSIPEAGRYNSGMPLQSSGLWRRTFVSLSRLDDLLKRVRRLERTVRDDRTNSSTL